ncbi:MAG: hypothetical protein IT490_07530 [Candidatus Contendobacter sp.]|nr:hypothetical protein [Candidatus Contendobacter sp.]
MFRQKPPTSPPLDAVSSVDWAHGFHYLAPQSALLFGSNRREPKAWRPGVSLARRGLFTLLLPATRQPNPAFFHLKPDDWFPRRPPPEPLTDGYLSHQYEAVAHDRLIELGVLRHCLRIDITAWLRQQRGGSHD